MRTSFHHQPEAQHPNFQLPISWQADYPIFRRQSAHVASVRSAHLGTPGGSLLLGTVQKDTCGFSFSHMCLEAAQPYWGSSSERSHRCYLSWSALICPNYSRNKVKQITTWVFRFLCSLLTFCAGAGYCAKPGRPQRARCRAVLGCLPRGDRAVLLHPARALARATHAMSGSKNARARF